MIESDRGNEEELCRWALSANGSGAIRRYEAPVQLGGLSGGAWIQVRALGHAENLERESLGIRDTYAIGGSFGDEWRIDRRYDIAAMRAFDYQHCIVGGLLPVRTESGELEEYAVSGGVAASELLGRLPAGLGQWADECIDEVNMRGEQERGLLAEVKKSS